MSNLNKREIVKQIRQLEYQVAARELPSDVVAELLRRNQAKHYASADTVPMNGKQRRRAAQNERDTERKAAAADVEYDKLTLTLTRLEKKLGML